MTPSSGDTLLCFVKRAVPERTKEKTGTAIREVNVVKSARVGYSKMLLGVYAYFIEHKQRNTLIWLPTDGDAENFMKTHVEPTGTGCTESGDFRRAV